MIIIAGYTLADPDKHDAAVEAFVAEKAWRSVNKSITIGGVTVKVRGFGKAWRLKKLLLVNHR